MAHSEDECAIGSKSAKANSDDELVVQAAAAATTTPPPPTTNGQLEQPAASDAPPTTKTIATAAHQPNPTVPQPHRRHANSTASTDCRRRWAAAATPPTLPINRPQPNRLFVSPPAFLLSALSLPSTAQSITAAIRRSIRYVRLRRPDRPTRFFSPAASKQVSRTVDKNRRLVSQVIDLARAGRSTPPLSPSPPFPAPLSVRLGRPSTRPSTIAAPLGARNFLPPPGVIGLYAIIAVALSVKLVGHAPLASCRAAHSLACSSFPGRRRSLAPQRIATALSSVLPRHA
uniref:Uncharacterized protein n=1 Tax=Plectus sambesii TaxID=2011161 RepID=A0A914VL67_9BILA